MSRILILYGTTEGHTRLIANAIAGTLTTNGFEVDVVPAGTIDPDPEGYDGIAVAASVHGGRYQKPVGHWLSAHARELGAKPTAFISVCLGVLQRDPTVAAELDAIVHRLVDPAGWQPTITKQVAGALMYSRYGFFKRWILKRIASQAGGDTDTSRDYVYTDWDDLEAFAGDFGRRVIASRDLGERPVLPTIAKVCSIVAAAVLIAASAGIAYGQDITSEPARVFTAVTHGYALMHRRLEAQIGPIEITTSVDEINRIMRQLAAAIRTERVDAKQGDYFTPAVVHELRAAIDRALRANDLTAADVVNAGRVDKVDYGRIQLRVNDTFPRVLSVAMFPCVIHALPPLPPELQYRIVGDDLLLLDVHASLIVDILPSALADLTVR